MPALIQPVRNDCTDIGVSPSITESPIAVYCVVCSIFHRVLVFSEGSDVSAGMASLLPVGKQTYGYNYRYGDKYCVHDMWDICQYLMEVMVHANIEITYGKEHDRKFQKRRFHRKGLKNIKMEFLLICQGYNLKKFHIRRINQMKTNRMGLVS